MKNDSQTTLAVAVCLSVTPKSVTWLAFQTCAPPSAVARALRRLIADGHARYVTGRGFIAWSQEQQEEAESRIVEDMVRDLVGRAFGTN